MVKWSFTKKPETKNSDGFHGTRGHIFEDSDAAEYWTNIYEKAQYEGRHRFDPTFTWAPIEEKKLVRKVGSSPMCLLLHLSLYIIHAGPVLTMLIQVDLRIMFWAWLMFCSLDLNRRNINRAITDDMVSNYTGV
jgi:hypothetical protein